MRKIVSIFAILVSLPAFAQVDNHISIVENLPTASPYSDSFVGGRGGNSTASVTDTIIAIMHYRDSATAKFGHGASLVNNSTVSDSATYIHGLNLPADTLTESDNVSVTHGGAGGGAGHPVSTTDTINAVLFYRDSATASKNVSGSASSRSATDNLTFSDVVNKGVVVHASDSLIATSSVCALAGFFGLRENLSLSDQVTINAVTGGTAHNVMLSDTLNFLDSLAHSQRITLVENFTTQDALFLNGANSISLADSVTYSDSLQRGFQTLGIAAETFTPSDSFSDLSSHGMRVVDSFVYTDGISARKGGRRKRGSIIARLGDLP